MSEKRRHGRNFGPRLDLMLIQDRLLPRGADRFMHGFYAIVGLVLARKNIRHSRAYLETITGKPAGIADAWRHYRRLIESLHRKLRVCAGEKADFRIVTPDTKPEFEKLARSGETALFGTFHVGDSDLLGCMLSQDYARRVAMVRLRVGNSSDMGGLSHRYAGLVNFIWVNEPEDALLAIKDAILGGESLAMQCDRLEYGSRPESFPFLGAHRLFPFSIYHLAILFKVPATMSFVMTGDDGVSRIDVSDVFRPDPEKSREENLAAARDHFARSLVRLENALRRDPTQWFNFVPLNPEVAA